MYIKKYYDKKNVAGYVIRKERLKKNIKKVDLCRQLDLIGVSINEDELYLIESNKLPLKDFELIAICKVLGIDLNIMKDLIEI